MSATEVTVEENTAASDWLTEVIASLPPIMSPRVFGEAVDISVPTLTRWRKTWPAGDRLGPAFIEPEGGNMIRYARGDVARWLKRGHIAKGETE